MNNKIKFDHEYPKVWRQTIATLLYVRTIDAEEVQQNKDLIEYDTRYRCDKGVYVYPWAYYQLPKTGKLIQLVFIGNKNIPFCTLRNHTLTKEKYYADRIGEPFEVVMKHD